MVNHKQFTAEMNAAVMMVRTLINSIPTKDGILSQQLLIDYQNINGQALPLKKFGFDTIDDFLAASNDFILQKGRDGTRVLIRQSVDSAHIRKIIDGSKSIASRKKKSGPQPVLQPRRQPIQTYSARDENKFRSASAFSDIYAQLPNRSVKKAIATTAQQTSPKKVAPTVSTGQSSPPANARSKPIRSPHTAQSQLPKQQHTAQHKRPAPQSSTPQSSTPQLSPHANSFKAPAPRNINNNVMHKEAPVVMREPQMSTGVTLKLIQKPSLNSRLTRHQNTATETDIVATPPVIVPKSNTVNSRLARLQCSEPLTIAVSVHHADTAVPATRTVISNRLSYI